MTDGWMGRAKAELRELVERSDKLATFLKTDAYEALPADDAFDLNTQLAAMSIYAMALTRRINRASAK